MGQLLIGKEMLQTSLAHRNYPNLRDDNLGWVHGNAEMRIPFQDASSDVTYGIGLLNHINPEKWFTYLSNMTRITKPGGIGFHVIPSLDCEIFRRRYFNDQYQSPACMQFYTQYIGQESVVPAFEKAGICPVITHELWNLDTDLFPRTLKGLDLISVLPNRLCGLNLKSFSMHIEGLLTREAEKNFILGHRWRLKKPRHLLVAGRVV